ncbi:putative kinesin [Aspergillus brunneoviolaceus CBS 621.78]|uniref:Kinesin n=1 Tax=Aspergillus brunneoviolaceus CBS 621.78 TaxID=1450534 RepID=A0ACD1G289_9EURO|nr:putative kinesin [Aspergillus brunneoviolaceus CBS 621.78]RAH43279.1 putative kinesin [Aspergillus brunneoviolaceus CBS 621.78]
MASHTFHDYTIAWISARAMLDKIHNLPGRASDPNAYEFGELNGHHIVIAYLPNGIYGTVSAAAVVSRMRLTFPRLRKSDDIRLGDVVVSTPGGRHGGAVQGGQFEPTGLLNQPPQHMTANDDALLCVTKRFTRPRKDTDLFFCSSYHHADKRSDCGNCDRERLVKRPPRARQIPYIHYVIKDSETRDRLATQHGILCFEMEAAGLMNELPTLQKQWQGYAALTAAAYAKLLISDMPVCQARKAQHWMVPLFRNPNFVGRLDEIKKVEDLIILQDGYRRVAITGLGGIGKTQVALEIAHRIREKDRECSVFWVPSTFLKIAETVGISNSTPSEVKEQLKRYFSSWRAGKWLLIFDNADEPDVWLSPGKADSGLEDFLPQSEQGNILFTTRNRKLALKLAPFNIVSIPNEDRDIALQIMQKLLAQKDLLQDDNTTVILSERLDFLPLAITQASAYIIKNKQEQDAVELLSKEFRDLEHYKEIQNPVLSTWLISFNQVQSQSQLAADYLSFMACINPQNIPRSLLPLGTTKKRTLDALGLLNTYLFTTGQNMNISLHSLVHLATRNWLRSTGQFVFPSNHHANRELWREYLPHALALVDEDYFAQRQNDYAELIQNIADCLASDGRYLEAEIQYKALLERSQENSGVKHPDTLRSMSNLASTYWNQGRWTEAERLDIKVIEISQTVLGPEHPATLTSIANLASTYRNQGQWNKAEKLDIQALRSRKTVLGVEHPDTLTSMANLASTYRNQGRLDQAEKLHIQALRLRKTVLGVEHPDTLTSMANLASTYWNQGRWNEAEKLDIQVMKTSETVLGAEHPDTLKSIANLISTYQSQSRWDEAEKLGSYILHIRRRVLGAEHPDTLATIANLASTYQNQSRWDEAEKLGIQVMEIRKAILGAEHPDTLRSMAHLAYTWKSQERLLDALSSIKNCCKLCHMVYGSDHPDTKPPSLPRKASMERRVQNSPTMSINEPTISFVPASPGHRCGDNPYSRCTFRLTSGPAYALQQDSPTRDPPEPAAPAPAPTTTKALGETSYAGGPPRLGGTSRR